jgi:hypothetical protein
MRWLRSAKNWIQADRFFDLFYAFAHDGLYGLRHVLSEFANFRSQTGKPSRKFPYRPWAEEVEPRVVPAVPVAVNDSFIISQGNTVSANGVQHDDSDADLDTLTASLVSDVSHGTLTLDSDGTVLYVPDTGVTERLKTSHL